MGPRRNREKAMSDDESRAEGKAATRREEHCGAPALAAIVVIPDTYDTVRRTMGALRAQTAAGQMEVVLVAPSDQQIRIDESELECFWGWRLVEVERITSIASGFVAGVCEAQAPIVALTEDHSFPDAAWAEVLIAAHRQPWAAVGPSMRNGNPDKIVSWADFHQAYGEWAAPVSSQTVRHLPGHNSSYKREILLGFGSELTVLMEAESVLHRHIRAHGYKLLLEPATCTTHLNFASWSSWIPSRYYAGRQFAATWAHSWSRPRRLLFTVASPLIPWVRLWRIQKHVRRGHRPGFAFRVLPVVLVGLLIEGLGQMMGYAAGYGVSIEKMATYEFHRVEHGGE